MYTCIETVRQRYVLAQKNTQEQHNSSRRDLYSGYLLQSVIICTHTVKTTNCHALVAVAKQWYDR